MRIAIVSDWFLKLVIEGQAAALKRAGHDVLLVTRDWALEFGDDAAERQAVLDRLAAQGVEIIQVYGRRLGPEMLKPAWDARRAFKRWKPDVVSAHENTDARLLWVARGVPTVLTIHDPEPHPGAQKPGVGDRLGRGSWLRAADRLVVHGEGLIPQLPEGLQQRQVRVVPHGIDVQDSPLPAPQNGPIVLFGRLEPYKGVAVLARAMEELWKRRPDARLVVAGRGPAARDVPQHEQIELRERYIPESEVSDLLKEASVFVLPYTQASQSGVGLLAIAAGVPIVVTDTGALTDLAADPSYVAEPGDPSSLATALERALEGGESQRHDVQEFARRTLSWDVVAQRYLDVYREVAR